MAGRPDKSRRMIPWLYDLVLWLFTCALDLFFREIYPRGAWRIPERGPVLIVAAPHANQFVDSAILMHLLKSQAKRRVSFLIAQKSMNEPYIGALASCMGALPVVRSMDLTKPGKGTIYQPDPESDPALIHGIDTDFTQPEFTGGSLTIKGNNAPETASIDEILGPTTLRLKKPFTSRLPDDPGRKGTRFKVAPHVDQSQMFDAVYKELSSGGCIGIFPEGGSHDRSNLLPLKAGAALMSLGALARDPECGLSIIPCGMNYFHAHKFRSRGVIEFGRPIHVHPDQVAAFKAGGTSKRNAVGSLLETIYEGLESVTQISPDHETLILVQSTRKLYNPISKKIPLPLVIEFNRRLLKGYTKHQDDPRVKNLKKMVNEYNRRLESLGIRDHQVEWGNIEEKPWWLTLITLFYRLTKLIVLSFGVLPGVLLFWPVFVTTKVISEKKRRKALAASVVKLQGHDVVGTWKILVAMGLAPTLYVYYTIIVTAWLRYNRNDGYYTNSVPWWMVARTYVPDFVPLWIFAVCFYAHMGFVSYAALRFGEVGMDIIKSLPPLLVALSPLSSSSLIDLRQHREALSERVTQTINDLGFGIMPDVDAEIPTDSYKLDAYQSYLKSMPPSEPSSRERSRSRSNGPGGAPSLKALSSINSEGDLAEIDRKIQTNLKGRGRRSNTLTTFETGESILKYKPLTTADDEKKKQK
ncbi:acyltransferase [Penicillium cataractarum]|uniref:Acyltransferase n=1 Tax=Penicillium cataractarum TaxID=2100454 RepID=A0A9W9RFX2_9EURO|nr:acyltransferase [Penicillium cataractarum]KAJ5359523.1 acyltransferase [Penicillium cataractarum]